MPWSMGGLQNYMIDLLWVDLKILLIVLMVLAGIVVTIVSIAFYRTRGYGSREKK